jgi:hypothetical protein
VEGAGSTFSFTVPMAPGPPVPGKATATTNIGNGSLQVESGQAGTANSAL